MTQPLRLAIHGASGRMGRALIALASDDPRFALQRAIVAEDSASLGHMATAAIPFAAGWGEQIFDVVIDFSSAPGLLGALDYCQAHAIALVSGTTGLDNALTQRLLDASTQIPVLQASNFSLGVAVLTRLLREAAAILPDWDLEIIEAHHARKRDAPSGTALSLGQAAAAARGFDLDAVAVRGRDGLSAERASASIGFASVRAGDIVGEHTALLASTGERLELTHRATDRSIFARGALNAAAWLASRGPGNYHIDNLLDPSTSSAIRRLNY